MNPEQFDWQQFNLDYLVHLLTTNPPWWMYVALALIPFSLGVITRELCCWFWKINRLARSLARIEEHLQQIAASNKNSAVVTATQHPSEN